MDLKWLLIAPLVFFLTACASSLEKGNAHYAKQEFDVAAYYWNPLAQSGNPYAQHNVGLLWEQGLGSTPKNTEQAALWFLKAAQQNLPDAMVRLAPLQEELGYPEAAISWLVLAARWGNNLAVEALRARGREVPEADLLQAQMERQRIKAENANNALVGLTFIGALIGATKGNVNNRNSLNSVYIPPTTDVTKSKPQQTWGVSTSDNSCSSDYSCGVGYKCVKNLYSSTGACMKTVDKDSIRTFDLPSHEGIGVKTEGSCLLTTDCPLGFKCDRLSKACVK